MVSIVPVPLELAWTMMCTRDSTDTNGTDIRELASIRSPVVDEERMRPGDWLDISARCYLLCFDTDGWVRTSGL